MGQTLALVMNACLWARMVRDSHLLLRKRTFSSGGLRSIRGAHASPTLVKPFRPTALYILICRSAGHGLCSYIPVKPSHIYLLYILMLQLSTSIGDSTRELSGCSNFPSLLLMHPIILPVPGLPHHQIVTRLTAPCMLTNSLVMWRVDLGACFMLTLRDPS